MWEVIEKSTGVRMSRTPEHIPGQPPPIMGRTLFKSELDAWAWLRDQRLEATHVVILAVYEDVKVGKDA